jgi:hypothetical protein
MNLPDPTATHTPAGRLVIDLHTFPVEGKDFAGDIQADIFLLEDGGPTWVAPLTYDLHVELKPGWIVVSGLLETSFDCTCVRCLEGFRHLLILDDYSMELELLENSTEADLTEQIREDILLALPDHPHCDEAYPDPRVCAASSLFRSEREYSVIHEYEKENTVKSQEIWGTLDKLELPTSPERA